MSASTIAAAAALIDAHRALIPLIEEHLEDNDGEILPHLVLSDVIRWLVAHRETDPQSCNSVSGYTNMVQRPQTACLIVVSRKLSALSASWPSVAGHHDAQPADH